MESKLSRSPGAALIKWSKISVSILWKKDSKTPPLTLAGPEPIVDHELGECADDLGRRRGTTSRVRNDNRPQSITLRTDIALARRAD